MPIKLRLVWEKNTVRYAVYSEQDGRMAGKVYLPLDEFPNRKPPMLLWMECSERQAPTRKAAK